MLRFLNLIAAQHCHPDEMEGSIKALNIHVFINDMKYISVDRCLRFGRNDRLLLFD